MEREGSESTGELAGAGRMDRFEERVARMCGNLHHETAQIESKGLCRRCVYDVTVGAQARQ